MAAARPDQLAGMDVPEIVQRHLEDRSDDIAVIEPKPSTGIADVTHHTGACATLLVVKDQRAVRRLAPGNLPPFSHRCLRSIGTKSTASEMETDLPVAPPEEA